MKKNNIQQFFSSTRNRLIIVISLVIIVSILLITKFVLNKDSSRTENITNILSTSDDNVKKLPGKEQLAAMLPAGIDSVLKNFGIKNEWITSPVTDKNSKGGKTPPKDAELFVKNVLIPNDLTSIEVNADITSYLNTLGLSSQVNEDIVSKDVTISVLNPDTTIKSLPLAKVNIIHSDKVNRESAVICLVINNVNEYSPEEAEKFLINKNEFSFVFPRNLDEIDLQNKLLHSKKDVIINLTVGGKDNYETDFNASMDEKTIHERVKSFTVDYPTITAVILTKKDADIPLPIMSLIIADLNNYKIRIIQDMELMQLLAKADEDSKEKFILMGNNIRQKGSLSKSMISAVNIGKDEFDSFYDQVLTLKKLGYKFYNFSDYAAKKEVFEKEQKEKEEKLKELKQKEDQKKQTDKKDAELKKSDKKTTDKKSTDKKSDKKSTDTKKKTDTKKPSDKKTETKKKTDVKKK